MSFQGSDLRSSRFLKKLRPFSEEDISAMLKKLFSEFDQDKNHRFTRM